MFKSAVLVVAALVVLAALTLPTSLLLPSASAEEVSQESAVEHTSGYDASQWRDFAYRVANFSVYAIILFFLLRKPVANFFKTRRQSIAETLNELQKRTELLEGKNRLLTDKLGELDKERQNILLQYQSDGEKERERIISEAQKTAKIIVERAEQTIEQEVKAAKRRLTVETGELSIKLARELLVKSVDEEDRNRLIHEFIGQVVKLPARN